jgi:hypothetical protein
MEEGASAGRRVGRVAGAGAAGGAEGGSGVGAPLRAIEGAEDTEIAFLCARIAVYRSARGERDIQVSRFEG